MKRITILAFVLIALNAFSQTEESISVFSENFTDVSAIPTDWFTTDDDNDGNTWMMDEYADLGEVYIVSESWNEVALTPNNYLISPDINLATASGTITLRYSIAAAGGTFFEENYSLYISDNPTAVISETLTATESDGAWAIRTVDLTEYAGDNIYLSWRHHDCTDMYKLMLDSVEVYYDTENAINEQDNGKISVFPNPSSDYVKISANLKNYEVKIFNVLGKNVMTVANVNDYQKINISNLPSGNYLIKVETIEGIFEEKFTVIR